MDNNLPIPGFTDSDFGGMNFDIPAALNDAPDVSRLPEANITYADSESSGGSTLRAFENTAFASQPAQPQRPENMHEYFEREARDTGPSYSMESRGYHEPSWGDASAKTAARLNESQIDNFGGAGNILSVFNTRPGEEENKLQESKEISDEDDLIVALTSYIETYYSEQLKKFKPGMSEKLAKAISEKVKTKILPEFFQKKTGDGKPRKVVTTAPTAPSKQGKFDFRKFVATDF